MDFIINWGSIYLTTYNIIKNENLKKTYDDNKNHYNIKLIWNHYLPSYYELSDVAILSICPSEASVKRSFFQRNMIYDVHTLERNRLSNEMIEAEMNIKNN